jgi:Sec-independent protein secretion pathway component TatC
MQIAIAIIALLVVSFLISASLNFTTAFLAIPLLLMFVGALLGKEQFERQQKILKMKKFRRDAQARSIGFDARDKKTTI